MYYSTTGTATYTIVDIRKAFEGFESDLRMIARLTNTWSMEYLEMVYHDVIKLAEAKYLSTVSIFQENANGVPIRATKFVVNTSGTGMFSDRAGGNNWSSVPDANLRVVLHYTQDWQDLTAAQKSSFQSDNDFCLGWTATNTNTDFPGLRHSTAQLYASNGYELKKHNYN